MPTYEYLCQECGHRFDLFQSIKAEPARRCPLCQGPVERLLGTGGGMIFKGTGFYITDYRSQNYLEKARSESNSDQTGGSKAVVKSEAKTEVGPEIKTATVSGGTR